MKKNKGFTLIELLAVIVILAIIALIASPMVLKYIENSKKEALRTSVYGIMEATSLYASETELKGNVFSGKTFTFPTNELNFKGKKPTGGTVTINKKGNVKVDSITDGKYCANKEYNEKEVRVELCDGEGSSGTVDSSNIILEGNYTIYSVEDLLYFRDKANALQIGTAKVTLGSALDFTDDNSYSDPLDTSYGDINGDGVVSGIKQELTTGSGFATGINTNGGISPYSLDQVRFGEFYNSSKIKELEQTYFPYLATATDGVSEAEEYLLGIIFGDATLAQKAGSCSEDDFECMLSVYQQVDVIASAEKGLELSDFTNITADNFYDILVVGKYAPLFASGNEPGAFRGFEKERNAITVYGDSDEVKKSKIEKYIKDNNLDDTYFNIMWYSYMDGSSYYGHILNYYLIEKWLPDIEHTYNPAIIGDYVFDGQGNSIKNYMSKTTGLFAYAPTEIKNVKLENIDINTTNSKIGGLANYAYTNITNSSVSGTLNGYEELGMLVGEGFPTITNSSVSGTITGYRFIGGLLGYNYSYNYDDVIINDSNSSVNINATGGNVGGLVGENFNHNDNPNNRIGIIKNSYATGDITADGSIVGGLVGSGIIMIENSYATGNVSGSTYIGGLIGYGDVVKHKNNYATGKVTANGKQSDSYSGGYAGVAGDIWGDETGQYIDNCYATGEVSGKNYSGGFVGSSKIRITNSYAANKVTGSNYTGGFAGSLYNTDSNDVFQKNYSTGTVTGSQYVGGLIGYTSRINIDQCFSSSNVNGNGWDTGGLIGLAGGNNNTTYTLNLTNSYSTGNVTSSADYTGGLVGRISNLNLLVSNSYSISNVSITNYNEYAGGLAGAAGTPGSGTFSNIFVTGDIRAAYNNFGNLFGNYSDTNNTFTLDNLYFYENQKLYNQIYQDEEEVAHTDTDKASTVSLANLKTSSWYKNNLKLSSDYWEFKDGYYPRLKNVGGQSWIAVPTE